ncbi:MAG: hypothetical protein EA401_06475 [Planctomycetota bacterium]|nr:MAG: hypothetical protein EA401_06475 [Planctomycetota bacterium]
MADDEGKLAITIGSMGYASPLFAFLLFGLFSLMIQGLCWKRFFPFPIGIFAVFGAVIAALMQWMILAADAARYDMPWYYGLIEVFRIVVDPVVYTRLGFICGLALPALGIIAATLGAFICLLARVGEALTPPQEEA